MAGSRYRSAKSGRYVTSKHGKASPRTTVREAAGKSGSTGGSYRSAISSSSSARKLHFRLWPPAGGELHVSLKKQTR